MIRYIYFVFYMYVFTRVFVEYRVMYCLIMFPNIAEHTIVITFHANYAFPYKGPAAINSFGCNK